MYTKLNRSKKFDMIVRPDDNSKSIANGIKEKLVEGGWEFASTDAETVIVVGGDGTMLEAFHQFDKKGEDVDFIVLNTGHLGFYADWSPKEMDTLVESIFNKEPAVVCYPIVEMTLANGEVHRAINEITIKNKLKTFIAKVYLNGEFFEEFRGDGLCISTPSGSTAYNKSVGGAIVHPSLKCIQLSEIAAINSNLFRTLGSSIILPSHHSIEIRFDNHHDIIVVKDHLQVDVDNISNLKFTVSDKSVHFSRYNNLRFWERVKKSFIQEGEK